MHSIVDFLSFAERSLCTVTAVEICRMTKGVAMGTGCGQKKMREFVLFP